MPSPQAADNEASIIITRGELMMDINKTNAVTSSSASKLALSNRQNGKTALDAKDGKQEQLSPSTVVSLQNAGKATASSSTENSSTGEDNPPSAVKSFTYGVLNLPDPSATAPAVETSSADNSYFTAGRWAAAAVTVGTLVSLVV